MQQFFLPRCTKNIVSFIQGIPPSICPSSSMMFMKNFQISVSPLGNCMINTSRIDYPNVFTGSFKRRQSPGAKCKKSALQREYPFMSKTTHSDNSNLVAFLSQNGPAGERLTTSKMYSMLGTLKYSSSVRNWLKSNLIMFLGVVGVQGGMIFLGRRAPCPFLLSQPVIALRLFCLAMATSWQETLETSKMTSRFFLTLILLTSLVAVSSKRTRSAEGWSSRQQQKAYLRSSTTSSWQSRQSPLKYIDAKMLQLVSLSEHSLPNVVLSLSFRKAIEGTSASSLVWKKWKRSLSFSKNSRWLQMLASRAAVALSRQFSQVQWTKGDSNLFIVDMDQDIKQWSEYAALLLFGSWVLIFLVNASALWIQQNRQTKTINMEIEMQIPKIIDETIHPVESKEPLNQQRHQETPYRWVIVALFGLALVLNGLTNNAVTPLQHKMTAIYAVSETKVSLSVILNLLVFFIANFPANKIIDSKGLRVGLIIGTSFYFIGSLCYSLVNKSFNFVIVGTVFLGLGQPFLLNSPAKVAASWFFPKNRAFATSLMVGISLIGMGIGFLVPTLVVREETVGEEAQAAIGHLYLAYFILSGICLILCLLFMQAGPEVAPSEGATAEKNSSIKESLRHIKGDRNLWTFFLAYCIGYGSLICFATNCNFLIKPYGYSDFVIAINGVMLLLFGTIAAVVFSFYIKKTYNYKRVLKVVSRGSALLLLILCIWLNSANAKIITTLIITLMGAFITPTVPICYDLGCQISFPLGEAQVTGVLNGGAMLWGFLSTIFMTSAFGYGSETSSMIIMGLLSVFVIISAVIFSFVNIDLKRRNYETGQTESKSANNEKEMSQVEEETANSSKDEGQKGVDSPIKGKYQELVEETMGREKAEDIIL